MYSLKKREAAVRYLERVDPEAARRARARYGCFDHYGGDEQSYGYQTGLGISESCENDVVQQAVDLQRRAWECAHRDGHVAEDDFFSAEQNALVVRDAEKYYRSMFRGRVNTWNLRDGHMAQTLHAVAAHLEVFRHGAHRGLGAQVARRRHARDGNITSRRVQRGATGSRAVRARARTAHRLQHVRRYGNGSRTTGARRRRGTGVRQGMQGSCEELFHNTGLGDFLVTDLADFREARLQRAIGVVYRPETERWSHYVEARIADQFDALIHIDYTNAVEPLPEVCVPDERDLPETYPMGV